MSPPGAVTVADQAADKEVLPSGPALIIKLSRLPNIGTGLPDDVDFGFAVAEAEQDTPLRNSAALTSHMVFTFVSVVPKIRETIQQATLVKERVVLDGVCDHLLEVLACFR